MLGLKKDTQNKVQNIYTCDILYALAIILQARRDKVQMK